MIFLYSRLFLSSTRPTMAVSLENFGHTQSHAAVCLWGSWLQLLPASPWAVMVGLCWKHWRSQKTWLSQCHRCSPGVKWSHGLKSNHLIGWSKTKFKHLPNMLLWYRCLFYKPPMRKTQSQPINNRQPFIKIKAYHILWFVVASNEFWLICLLAHISRPYGVWSEVRCFQPCRMFWHSSLCVFVYSTLQWNFFVSHLLWYEIAQLVWCCFVPAWWILCNEQNAMHFFVTQALNDKPRFGCMLPSVWSSEFWTSA